MPGGAARCRAGRFGATRRNPDPESPYVVAARHATIAEARKETRLFGAARCQCDSRESSRLCSLRPVACLSLSLFLSLTSLLYLVILLFFASEHPWLSSRCAVWLMVRLDERFLSVLPPLPGHLRTLFEAEAIPWRRLRRNREKPFSFRLRCSSLCCHFSLRLSLGVSFFFSFFFFVFLLTKANVK